MGHEAKEPNGDETRAFTQLLGRIGDGEEAAREELVQLVYEQLKKTAIGMVRRESAGFTLMATDVVHEAYLRLFRDETGWENRRHFFGSAAIAMRRVLVDHMRRRTAGNRIPTEKKVALEGVQPAFEIPGVDLLALDRALDELAKENPRQAQLVELRYFGGLSDPEVAEVLGISTATVTRDWRVARVRLKRHMES